MDAARFCQDRRRGSSAGYPSGNGLSTENSGTPYLGYDEAFAGEIAVAGWFYSQTSQPCFVTGSGNVSHVGFTSFKFLQLLHGLPGGGVRRRAYRESNQGLFQIQA